MRPHAITAFVQGVTAAASAGVYFSRGDILPIVLARLGVGVLQSSESGE